MTDEDKDHIIEEVKKTIGLDNYVKSSELSTLLDNIIGNLEDKSTVVDYINSLSYNKLFDVPIVNLIGTLTVPVKISSLDDGIYKVKGQCIIGGNNTTVQSSADDVLYLVSHDADTSSTTITKMQGKSITLYFIQQDGEYTAGSAQGNVPVNGAALGTTADVPVVTNTSGQLVPHASGALGSAAFKGAETFATAAQGAKADKSVQSVSITSGTNNGTIKLTVNGKATDDIAVKGLGSAAYTASGAYATAAQGTKADAAMPKAGGTFTGTVTLAADPRVGHLYMQLFFMIK